MALYYKDYIEIDQDFIPVFSDEVDKRQPTRWKYFVPHQSMIDVLNAVIKSIESASDSDRKSIWLTGSYGTGKTFAAFVIKHMLEDNIDSVKEYFDKYALKNPPFERFNAIRQKRPILVVYRSGSGDIHNNERLLIEVQQSIKKALDEKKYAYKGGKTAVQSIVSKLTDPDSTFNFEKAFEKYRIDFGEYASPQQVIDELCNSENYALVERVATIMDKEGFAYFQNTDDIKNWIEDVIKVNKLGSIWLIWDEFTDYFRQNKAVSTLQELAHASSNMPFYLFLITHRNIDQFAMDDYARKLLRDRFKNIRFEMSDVTSYQLLANAINIKSEKRNEWDEKLLTLWDEVRECVKQLKNANDSTERLDEQYLKRLIPIHPFSAYLLSVISRRLSSNQRTMFRFIEENAAEEGEKTKYNFNWFIQTHSLDGWHWLTADILWDYFFKDIAIDDPDYSGEAHQIINYYKANFEKIPAENEDEHRVFKSAMLLIALNRILGSAKLLRPLESNLKLIFDGTPLYNRISDILNRLHMLGLINMNFLPGEGKELVIPLISYDKNKLNNIKEALRTAYSFDKCAEYDNILGKELLDNIPLTGPLALRFEPRTTSIKNFKRNFDNLQMAIKPYQIGLLFVIPSSDSDVVRLNELMQGSDYKYSRIVVVAVEQPFTDVNLDNWLKAKAQAQYSHDLGDGSNEKYYEKQARDCIIRWMSKVKLSFLTAYFMNEKATINKISELDKYLEKISSRIYTYGPERITNLEPLYRTSSYGEAAVLMGIGQKDAAKPYGELKNILIREGFWDNDDMFNKKPDHPISKMKKIVEEIMKSDTSVKLNKIWDKLEEAPFGLSPSPIACFLLGFLMKDYANNGYYKDDGINLVPLSAEGLAEAITSVIKLGKSNIAISMMTQEHQYFCNIMKAAFKIEGDMPKNIKQNIRLYLNNVKYPLWTLKYYLFYSDGYELKEKYRDLLLNVIDKLCEFVFAAEDNTTLSLVDDIAKMLKFYPEADAYFRQLVDIPNFKEGMRLYLEQKNPEIVELAKKANVGIDDLVNRIRNMMSDDAHWLWQEEKLDSEIMRLKDEYSLINALNEFIGDIKSNLGDLTDYVRSELNNLKLPNFIIRNYLGNDAGRAFDLLVNFVHSGGYGFAEKSELAALIKGNGKYIKNIISDQYAIFADYLRNSMKVTLPDDSIRELYDKLPIENYPNEEAFNKKINDMLNELETLNLIKNLRDLWQNISGTSSPRQWSNDMELPILCLPGMDNHDLWDAFEIINKNGNGYTKHNIQEAINTLNNNNILSIISDKELANKAFIESIAGEYAYLVFDSVGIETIKSILKDKFGSDMYDLGGKKPEIQKFIQNYLADYYKQKAYERVLQKIDYLSAERAKEYLKELIKNEPLVGIKILATTEQE